MSTYAYQYVVLRCVPRPEREEFVNVGVVLYCQEADLLAVEWRVDRQRIAAFAPDLDPDRVCAALEFVSGVCAGDARGGEAASRPLGQRFGFLKSPKSTVVQPGPVHGGVAEDPAAELSRLKSLLVG
ncbi:DUF3037 domain-containing protein [Aeromicrobium sp. Marseille-Q0843]|uniref:DUF3037 domain-containing protein n=1 Tax=Aeromicrobium phoceense TaxID=2754045 RepID=A0A838XM22_9ACTN|nr:DUF3037 domain-containing protein [Aeromicrobium phoceense]MBA4607910.1 DUF3037 domain-containing protein [Aeromicrobium phoceense]